MHPQFLEELRALRSPARKTDERVFSQHPHPDCRIRIDMLKAGIDRLDAMGRTLDFHALRYTFATTLACSGVSPRLAQELLLHSDPRLTANIYTDATLLPTFEAVTALGWQTQTVNSPQVAETAGAVAASQIAPQKADADGLRSAWTAVIGEPSRPALNGQKPHKQSFGQILANFAKGVKWSE